MEDIEKKVTVPIKVSFETEVSDDYSKIIDNFREFKVALWATGGRNLTEMSTLKLYPSDNRTVGVFSPCGRVLGEAFYSKNLGYWNIWCPIEERWIEFKPENLYWGELTDDELSKINKVDE